MKVFKKVSWTKIPTGKLHTITRHKDEASTEPLMYLWSPVPHLLASNVAPSENEIALIHRAIIETAERRLETQRHIDLADDPSANNEDILFVRQHQAILSSIRRIPVEIWQEIILWSVIGRPLVEVKAFRWQLSYVCQAWRDATLSLSVLWAELPTVRLDPVVSGRFGRAQHQMNCLAEVLKRSGKRPLVVDIDDSGLSTGKDAFYPALDLLVKHSERWRTASISVPMAAMDSLHRLRGRLPLLQTLSLHMRIGNEYTAIPLNMFEIAPTLHRVHISGSVPQHLKLPISQLAHYKHLCISPGYLTQVIDYSSLESLMISQKSYPISFPAATFRRLKKLEFITDTPAQDAYTLRCFDSLKLPALEELTVAFPFYSQSIVPSLVRMLKNNTTPSRLQALRICPGTMEPGELAALLRLSPALITLDTTCPPRFDLERLAFKMPQEEFNLVPYLQTCKFMFDSVVDSILDSRTRNALNNMALSRCEAQQDLIPLNLTVYSMYPNAHDVPWSQFKQFQLENWNQNPTTIKLAKISQLLQRQYFPSIRQAQNARRRQMSINKIIEDLNSFNNAEIKNPQDIYISGIHLILKQISEAEDKINASSEFNQRIKSALMRCDSLLLPLIGDVHWSCEGPRSVTYIHDDDALRASSNALDIIYGLKDGMSVDDSRWPSHLGTYGISIYWPHKVGYFSVAT